MRKTLLALTLVGLLAVGVSPARADSTADGLESTSDVLEGVSTLLKLLASVSDPLLAASTGLDFLNGRIQKADRALSKQEIKAIKDAVEILQARCSEIPGMQAKIAQLGATLETKADKKAVEAALEKLRGDMRSEIARVDSRVDRVDERSLENRKAIDKVIARVIEAEEGRARRESAFKADVLLVGVGKLKDVRLTRIPDKTGVYIRDPGGRDKHYRPGEVEEVLAKEGRYVWDEGLGNFKLVGKKPVPDEYRDLPPEERARVLKSAEEQNANLRKVLVNLSLKDRQSLRRFVAASGKEFDRLPLLEQMDFLKLKLRHDYEKRIAARGGSPDVELRLIIEELANATP